MKALNGLAVCLVLLIGSVVGVEADAPVSEASQECLDCHESIHPGIVESWRKSRHAATTPDAAVAVKGLARKISSTDIPDALRPVSVGCAECHTQRAEAHGDSFEHNGYTVHMVVSSKDCAVCHVVEQGQYDENIMAHANH